MKIEIMRVGALAPYARNSRTHSDAEVSDIARSIGGETVTLERVHNAGSDDATLEATGAEVPG